MAEIEQCAHDIVDWFRRKGDLRDATPMERKEIQSIEKALDQELPESICALLEKQNGGIWFNEYKSLSSDEMIDKVTSKGWKSSFIPFAADLDEACLIIDTSDEGAIYEYDQENGKRKLLAESLPEYLEKFRDQLLSGQYEFIQDVGIVERARK